MHIRNIHAWYWLKRQIGMHLYLQLDTYKLDYKYIHMLIIINSIIAMIQQIFHFVQNLWS